MTRYARTYGEEMMWVFCAEIEMDGQPTEDSLDWARQAFQKILDGEKNLKKAFDLEGRRGRRKKSRNQKDLECRNVAYRVNEKEKAGMRRTAAVNEVAEEMQVTSRTIRRYLRRYKRLTEQQTGGSRVISKVKAKQRPKD